MRNIRNVFQNVASLTSDLNKSISIRMTQFFVLLLPGWIAFNLVVCCTVKVEITICFYFTVLLLVMLFFITIGYIFKIERFLADLFNLAVLLVTPVTWYVCGGTTSSSVNSMFIMAIVYFGLCSYGWRRVAGTVISIAEVGGVTVITKRIPELAMPPYAPGQSILTCNSCIGFSTTMVIVLLLFKQISEYRLENERSEAYKEKLRQSNALQKKFLANMSHEIRSPLGIVLGFNELIAKSDNISEIREYSHNISSAGETLRVVINDILDYSKIESGKLEIIENNYSLKNLISEIDKNIRLKASEKVLKFDIEVGENVPDMLYGDDVRIRQCLINILSNAIKYTEKGSVLLKVYGEIDKEDESICNLSFLCHDTGKGIASDAIPHLFSAFERIDESHIRGIEGTGLGLAITKALVDEMNGIISVESVLNEGSDFLITLAQKISDKKSYTDSDLSELSINGIQVAVVDDTKANLTLCKKILELKGANVDTFISGKLFLEALSAKSYDILLIDHMMPEMDGVKVLKKVKETEGPNKETPCLVFTANAMAGAEKEYLDLGFNGFISKPINSNDFVARIIAAKPKK